MVAFLNAHTALGMQLIQLLACTEQVITILQLH